MRFFGSLIKLFFTVGLYSSAVFFNPDYALVRFLSSFGMTAYTLVGGGGEAAAHSPLETMVCHSERNEESHSKTLMRNVG